MTIHETINVRNSISDFLTKPDRPIFLPTCRKNWTGFCREIAEATNCIKRGQNNDHDVIIHHNGHDIGAHASIWRDGYTIPHFILIDTGRRLTWVSTVWTKKGG